MKILCLIPARSGSKRIANKNIRVLNNHPLIAYAIAVAKKTGIFSRIVMSTDSEKIREVALYYGAEVPFLRPAKFAESMSPDIEWITHLFSELSKKECLEDAFCILRPTNPFRKASTILRAWETFKLLSGADSLRAVEKCRKHPAKMWFIQGDFMKPVISNPKLSKTPWHSMPYQALPEMYEQNASLEIAWSRIVLQDNSISGKKIMPFIMDAYEGFDINDPLDWKMAEEMLVGKKASLPRVDHPPYGSS